MAQGRVEGGGLGGASKERANNTKEGMGGAMGERRKGWVVGGRGDEGKGWNGGKDNNNNSNNSQANQMQWDGEVIGQGQRGRAEMVSSLNTFQAELRNSSREYTKYFS